MTCSLLYKLDFMNNPFFSIIIPTYNRAGLLKNLLETFIIQTYVNFEVIVVDDGGNDQSSEVVSSFKDHRFRYYKKENGGVSSARNFGLQYAKGSYINFFDSDDLTYPNHLESARMFFENNKQANVVVFDYAWGNTDKSIYRIISNRYQNLNKAITKRNFISTNCIFISKKSMDLVKFNENLTISEDWECWLRLSLINKFYAVNTVTSYIVEHQNRGINNISLQHLINQKTLFMDSFNKMALSQKEIKLNRIESHFCSFIALNAALKSEKSIAFNYFIKSVILSLSSLFSRRSLAIIKHLVLKH